MPFVAPASSYTATQFVCRCHRTRKGLSTEFYRESCVRSLFFSSFLSRGQLNACVCVHLYILYIRGRAPAEARSGTRQNGGAQTNNKILIYWNMTTFLYSVSMLQYTQRTDTHYNIRYDIPHNFSRRKKSLLSSFARDDLSFHHRRHRICCCSCPLSFLHLFLDCVFWISHIYSMLLLIFFFLPYLSALCVCVMFCIFTFVVVRSLIASHFNLFNFN